MASTGPPERESTTTSQGTAPSPSTSEISSSPCLCSSCLDWVSAIIPWRSVQTNSRATENEVMRIASSASTTNRMPDNEVMSDPSASASTSASATGAFQEIAPSPSNSASARIQSPCYDVFINHYGSDVKHTLASSIYDLLDNMKVKVFLDSKELECGDFFPKALEAAIRRASLHIGIFSQNYAKSPWCLEELSLMLKAGAKFFPVFYHVDPADLRHVDRENGMYAKIFKEHESKGRYSTEKLQEWKKALYTASFYTGDVIKTNDEEKRLLKNIERCVFKVINDVPLEVAKHPVGLTEIVEDFEMETLLSGEDDQVVQIVGIWGMGGLGKTTLAKELYNRKSSLVERSSFLFNVRDAASKDVLHNTQMKLLKDLGLHNETFHNIEEGKDIILKRLRNVRVLIVIDDVDHVEQLDALLPTKDKLEKGLEKGSLIIVTTRAYNVLISWGISSTYKMRSMDPLHAKQLFCWHAFLKSCPLDGFEELVERFLEQCKGLPLALKVFGAQLYGVSCKDHWESELDKISRVMLDDIKKRLKISYDTLDDEEKEIFLDVACFFIGEESSLAIEVWNGLGWSGLQSWRRLLHRCLVEVEDNNLIRMHDQIRDMGRDIANKKPPYRLWFPQPNINLQKQEEGVEMLPVMSDEFDEIPSKEGNSWLTQTEEFGLKFLVTNEDYFNEVMGEISRELVWLRWFDIRQRNLPSGLSLEKLRVLELFENYSDEHHLEELWGATEGEAPLQLRHLLLSNCLKFQGFPKSIGQLKYLKKIVITDGENVRGLPDEFCFLQSLEHLVFNDCPILSLPSNFGNLSNLRYLSLHHCYELRRLPVSFKNLMLLEHLNLLGCDELAFTSNFLEKITKLEFLNLYNCRKLKELPLHLTNQASLRELNFSYTRIRELPDKIGVLGRLAQMSIENVLLTSFPNSLGDLSSLMSLRIRDCRQLERLPDSLGDLSSLASLVIQNCRQLECLPDSLGVLSSLTELTIQDCRQLERLPKSIGQLNNLQELTISGCRKLERQGVISLPKSIRQLNNLQSLNISCCPISELDFGAASLPFGLSNLKVIYLSETEVCKISLSEDCCLHLESLYVEENHHLEQIEALPLTLKEISLTNCEKLKSIPSFARFTSLTEFELRDCIGIVKVEGIENCTRLKELSVDTCWEEPGIKSLEHMQNLKSLKLRADKGSVIERWIQTIQKWPDQIEICTRAIRDGSSLVVPLLFPNLEVLDSFSNQKIRSSPELVQKYSSRGDATLFCFVINCVSSQMTLEIVIWERNAGKPEYIVLEKGRWAVVRVCTQRSKNYLSTADKISIERRRVWRREENEGESGEEDEGEWGEEESGKEESGKEDEEESGEEDEEESGKEDEEDEGESGEEDEVERGLFMRGEWQTVMEDEGESGEEDEVERGLFMRGEEQTVMEALCSLVPLLIS